MYIRRVADRSITVAQLRAEMAKILARLAKAGGHVYLTQSSEPRAVLVDIKRLEALIERLEYLYDSLEAVLAHQRLERGEETARPYDEVIAEIRRKRRKPTGKSRPLARRARVRTQDLAVGKA